MLILLLKNHSRFIANKFQLSLLQIWALIHIMILLTFLPFNAVLAGEIYSTGFESGALSVGKTQQNGFKWLSGVKTTVSADKSKKGAYSLKFSFPASVDGKDSTSEQRFYLGKHYPDLWVKYDLYIPNNYYHRRQSGSANNKGFMWLWSGTYDNSAREGPKLTTHFWPSGSNGNTLVAAYITAFVGGKYSINKNWLCKECGDGKSSQGIVANDRGHWMTIVIHSKYATIANNDGVYEIWKTNWQGNTVKLINIQNGPWYSTQPNSSKPARGFDKGYLLGWANSGFDEKTNLYIDNIQFSTSPLSSDSASSFKAPPKPPSLVMTN